MERGRSLAATRSAFALPYGSRLNLHGGPGHAAALLGAVPARFGATLAMVIVMLGTFLGAGIANIGTDAANLVDEPGAATHEGDAQATYLGAVEAQTCALRHAAQALVGTVITFLSATATGGDARLMLLVRHE